MPWERRSPLGPPMDGSAEARLQPVITLRTWATIGSPGSTPSPERIGISVGPNASKAACDSQTSNTWIAPSLSRATW